MVATLGDAADVIQFASYFVLDCPGANLIDRNAIGVSKLLFLCQKELAICTHGRFAQEVFAFDMSGKDNVACAAGTIATRNLGTTSTRPIGR